MASQLLNLNWTQDKSKERDVKSNTHNARPETLIVLVYCLLVSLVWYATANPIFGLAAALAPLGLLLVLSQTFWFILFFIVFSFFRIHEALPQLYSLKIPLLLSMGSLLGILWHLFISKQLKPYWHPALTWLVVFWVIATISVVFASNKAVAMAYFKGIYWKIIIMTLAILWSVNTSRHLSIISVVLILAGLLVSCVALYNSANGIGLVEGSRVTIGRDFGSMLGDPNDLALVLMFPFAFSISAVLTRGNSIPFRIICAVICFVLFSAIIATQSRGGLLGIMGVCGIFGLRYIKSKALLAAIAVVGAAGLHILGGISDRSSGGAAEEGIDASAMGRIYAWEAAFYMAVENPLTGVGLDNFFVNYFFYSKHWDGLNHAVHSTWFGVLAETGFLGLIVFIGVIVKLIRTAKGTIDKISLNQDAYPVPCTTMANAVYAGLVGTIVSGTFLTQGFNWPIYLLGALTISVAQIASQNEKAIHKKT